MEMSRDVGNLSEIVRHIIIAKVGCGLYIFCTLNYSITKIPMHDIHTHTATTVDCAKRKSADIAHQTRTFIGDLALNSEPYHVVFE